MRRLVDAGRLPAGTDTEAAGKVMFGVLPGFLLQRLVLDDIDPAELRRGARVLLAALIPDPATAQGQTGD